MRAGRVCVCTCKCCQRHRPSVGNGLALQAAICLSPPQCSKVGQRRRKRRITYGKHYISCAMLKAKGNSSFCPQPSPSTPIAVPWYTKCVLTTTPQGTTTALYWRHSQRSRCAEHWARSPSRLSLFLNHCRRSAQVTFSHKVPRGLQVESFAIATSREMRNLRVEQQHRDGK